MSETTIDPTAARDLYERGMYEDSKEPIDGWTVVNAEYSLGSGRWMENYWLILRNEVGELWAVAYQRGLTEMQPHEYPWDESWMQVKGRIPMHRVHQRKVTTFVYDDKPAKPDRWHTLAVERPTPHDNPDLINVRVVLLCTDEAVAYRRADFQAAIDGGTQALRELLADATSNLSVIDAIVIEPDGAEHSIPQP